MADANTVTAGLATLGGSGWVIPTPNRYNGGQDFLGSGTFAQVKAVANPPDQSLVFVNNYPPNKGSFWRYSAALADWFPIAPCKVYEKFTTTDGLAQTADQLLLAIPCEAALLANKIFDLKVSLGRNGTTDAFGATTNLRMGTAGTTADTSLVAMNLSTVITGTARALGLEFLHRMASAISAERLGGSPQSPWTGSSTTSGPLNNATAVPSAASQLVYLSITTTMAGTTDKPQIGYVSLEIQP